MIDPPLSAEDKAAVLALLDTHDLAQADASVAANRLNAPAVTTQTATVLRPFTRQEVLALLSPGTLGNIMGLPIAPKIIDALNAGDPQAVGEYVAALAANTKMTSEEAAAVLAHLQQTTSRTTTVVGPAPFAAAFPDLEYTVAGSRYKAFAHPDLIAEARS